MLNATPISRPVSSEHTSSCGVSRLSFYPSFQSVHSRQPHPFLQFMAATNRAIHPSGSSDRPLSQPVALAALLPQKNVGTETCPMVDHRSVATDTSAPVPYWLTLQAIRNTANLVTVARHPIQNRRLLLQSHYRAWRPPSLIMQSNAQHQMACPLSTCESMLWPICAPMP